MKKKAVSLTVLAVGLLVILMVVGNVPSAQSQVYTTKAVFETYRAKHYYIQATDSGEYPWVELIEMSARELDPTWITSLMWVRGDSPSHDPKWTRVDRSGHCFDTSDLSGKSILNAEIHSKVSGPSNYFIYASTHPEGNRTIALVQWSGTSGSRGHFNTVLSTQVLSEVGQDLVWNVPTNVVNTSGNTCLALVFEDDILGTPPTYISEYNNILIRLLGPQLEVEYEDEAPTTPPVRFPIHKWLRTSGSGSGPWTWVTDNPNIQVTHSRSTWNTNVNGSGDWWEAPDILSVCVDTSQIPDDSDMKSASFNVYYMGNGEWASTNVDAAFAVYTSGWDCESLPATYQEVWQGQTQLAEVPITWSSWWQGWVEIPLPVSHIKKTGSTNFTFSIKELWTRETPSSTGLGRFWWTRSGFGYDPYLEIEYANSPPELVVNSASVTVDEGTSATNSGTVSDADGDTLTLAASLGTVILNADNTFEWNYTPNDGPLTKTVVLTVTDSSGLAATDQALVTINNVAPTALFDHDPNAIEGASVELAFSNQYDPSPDDTAAGFLYSYDCTNDGTFEFSGSATASYDCVYEDDGVYAAKGRITDKDGGFTDYRTDVYVGNIAPTADFANVTGDISEGESATFVFSNPYDPSPVDTAAGFTYSFDCTNDGIFELSDTITPTFDCTYSDNGIFTAKGRIQDKDGGFTDYTLAVASSNVAPTAVFTSTPARIDEGGSVILSLNDVFDPGMDDVAVGFLYSFDCTDDGMFEAVDTSIDSYQCTYPDDGTFTARGAIKDKDGGFTEYTVEICVDNVAAVVGEISVPTDPFEIGTPVTVAALFTDSGVLDTHTGVWEWGDDTVTVGAVTEVEGSGTITGSYVYTTPGVYTLVLTVDDGDGGVVTVTHRYLVVYDSDGGFVTGSGKFDSPEGAYAQDPSLTGTAQFGFVSKYQKGASEPTGTTRFRFKIADFTFHSDTYDWLVVAGAKAQYKGVGTINGEGEYKFMLTAIDADINPNDSFEVDRYRIKIWFEDEQGSEILVYDNGLGANDDNDNATTEISSGSIVIHKDP